MSEYFTKRYFRQTHANFTIEITDFFKMHVQPRLIPIFLEGSNMLDLNLRQGSERS